VGIASLDGVLWAGWFFLEGGPLKAERRARIDHEIQREMARLLSTELKDPRLGFVTVTRVEITQDLQHAKVYVSVIGDRHVAKQSLLALESAKGFLRGELGHAIALRHTPELSFVEDRTTERAIELSRVLAETSAASAAAAAKAAEAEGVHDDAD
jgi:ribosome-binding factor A